MQHNNKQQTSKPPPVHIATLFCMLPEIKDSLAGILLVVVGSGAATFIFGAGGG